VKHGEETEIANFSHVLMMETEMKRATSEMPITDHEGIEEVLELLLLLQVLGLVCIILIRLQVLVAVTTSKPCKTFVFWRLADSNVVRQIILAHILRLWSLITSHLVEIFLQEFGCECESSLYDIIPFIINPTYTKISTQPHTMLNREANDAPAIVLFPPQPGPSAKWHVRVIR
jgi:hypothetical protein